MNTVDDVKQKLDIVDVVSQYVKLQKSGSNFKAPCPFHSEKTASFFVFPEKQSWHCFGACGTGGDIFSFVMKKEGVDFGQALRMMAEKAGVTLIHQSPQNAKAEHDQHENLYKINEVAAEYFHYLLLHSTDGETARQYVKKRSLASKSVEDFQIGYALNRWDDLSGHLIKAGYKENDILAAGLIVLRDKDGFYDRFRNRLMFPIRDIKGRVVGFGGRALDDSLPKYLNSPQTSIFDKSSIIYAIDRAQASIRQKDAVVITEGYMDTIAAHEYGFENTVASMGTALTEKQIATLRKLSKNIIFALDADQAGLQATTRSITTTDEQIPRDHWMAWNEGKTYAELAKYEIQVAEIVGGKDPDELIRKSPEKWTQLLSASQPIIDFTLKKEIATINLDKLEDKAALVSKYLSIIAQIDGSVRQTYYVNKLAALLQLDGKELHQEMLNAHPKKSNKIAKFRTLGSHAAEQEKHSRFIEEYCLALLLRFPNLRDEGLKILAEYFEHSENKDIFLKWQSTPDIQLLTKSIDPAMEEYLTYLLSYNRFYVPDSVDKENQEFSLIDCIMKLHEKHTKSLEKKKNLILNEMKGNNENEVALLQEYGIEQHEQLGKNFRKGSGFIRKYKWPNQQQRKKE